MKMINVSVVYGTGEQQWELPLQVAPNCHAAGAIRQSGILTKAPDLDLANMTIGIWGKKVSIDAALSEGDRIEIYRPLTLTPNEARLLRAKRAMQRRGT